MSVIKTKTIQEFETGVQDHIEEVKLEALRQYRIKWGFCPDCGLNLQNPDVAWHHERGGCNEALMYVPA